MRTALFAFETLARLALTLAMVTGASAAQAQLELSPDNLSLSTWVWLLTFSAMGWVCSSLPILAGWHARVGEERADIARKRYEIIRRVSVSICFGVILFFSWRQVGRPEMEALISAFGGAFLGDVGMKAYFRRGLRGHRDDRDDHDDHYYRADRARDRDRDPDRDRSFPRE
jgi:hypothetical protein